MSKNQLRSRIDLWGSGRKIINGLEPSLPLRIAQPCRHAPHIMKGIVGVTDQGTIRQSMEIAARRDIDIKRLQEGAETMVGGFLEGQPVYDAILSYDGLVGVHANGGMVVDQGAEARVSIDECGALRVDLFLRDAREFDEEFAQTGIATRVYEDVDIVEFFKILIDQNGGDLNDLSILVRLGPPVLKGAGPRRVFGIEDDIIHEDRVPMN